MEGMRGLLPRIVPHAFVACILVHAQGQGVPPRPSPSDYPVHQSAKDATLAAAIPPTKQIERMFSADIAKHYIVVEVAVYPQTGQAVNIEWLNFGLKIGDAMVYPEKPRDVATPWPDKSRVPDKGPTVITSTGVVYGRSSDPVNGKRTTWGTYEGVEVTNDPRAAPPPPPPNQGPDPQIVEQRVDETILPDGPANGAVAGYLFFPQYKVKRSKGSALELKWSRTDASVTLKLPDK